jgi:RimJ/RimL family protein N-acetyltransferase
MSTGRSKEFDDVDTCSTERLFLRRPSLSDRGVVHAIHADPLTNRFNPHGPATVTSSESMLLDWITHWENNGFGYWAISSNEAPDQIIGFGGIVRKNVVDRLGLNLYFRFAPTAWGKGFATEIATGALSVAFIVLGEAEVLAKVRALTSQCDSWMRRITSSSKFRLRWLASSALLLHPLIDSFSV